MALVTASYSAFHGQTFLISEQVTGGKLGDGAYLMVNDLRLWFGAEAIQILKG